MGLRPGGGGGLRPGGAAPVAAKPVVAAISEEKLALKVKGTLQEYCASNNPKEAVESFKEIGKAIGSKPVTPGVDVNVITPPCIFH